MYTSFMKIEKDQNKNIVKKYCHMSRLEIHGIIYVVAHVWINWSDSVNCKKFVVWVIDMSACGIKTWSRKLIERFEMIVTKNIRYLENHVNFEAVTLEIDLQVLYFEVPFSLSLYLWYKKLPARKALSEWRRRRKEVEEEENRNDYVFTHAYILVVSKILFLLVYSSCLTQFSIKLWNCLSTRLILFLCEIVTITTKKHSFYLWHLHDTNMQK